MLYLLFLPILVIVNEYQNININRRQSGSREGIQIRLLIVMKLMDDGLVHHILPKTKMKEVNEIYIVRDHPGPAMPKVMYLCPHHSIANIAFLSIIAKIFIALHVSITKKPNLIISYAMYPHGFIAYIVSKLTGLPLSISVIHINEMDAFGFIFPTLYLSVLHNCTAITTTGSKTKNKLVNRGIPAEKILILPHAVDLEALSQITVEKKFDVLYLGRIYERKHPDILLKAIHKVKHTFYKEIKMCIAGRGSPDYEKFIKQLIQDLDLTENVVFAGFVKDTREYYHLSRIYVLPTEAEGLPFTMLEAMACGVPVITIDAGDITDSAQNNVNAIVLEHWSDIDGFAQGIRVLLENSDMYNRLRENGLEEISLHHRNENVMATYREIFARVKRGGTVWR